jgi:hypothetical protein
MNVRSAAAAAAIAACSIAATCAAGAIAHAAPAASGCKPHTRSVAGQTAARALKTVAANIPAACGFKVSGYFLGAGFGIDGLQLDGATTYDRKGDVHLVYINQGVVIDAYRVGAGVYLRMYEYGEPNAAPDLNVRAEWNAFGVTSNAVIKAAGSAKWVRLTAAELKKFTVNGGYVGLGTPASLAANLVKGTGVTWKLAGVATVHGVRCTVLTQATDRNKLFPAERLYVGTATGLPVEVSYAHTGGGPITTNFGTWSDTTAVTVPTRVVAG